MKMNAAVLWDVDTDWSVEEVELDRPQEGEVLVSFDATGLCHSDHHIRTGEPSRVAAGRRWARGCGHRAGSRPGRTGPEGGRPRGGILPAGLRSVPLVCQRASEPV